MVKTAETDQYLHIGRHAQWLRLNSGAVWSLAPQAPRRLPESPIIASTDSAAVARQLWGGIGCEVVDHGTLGWRPEADYALWHLDTDQWQLIEWVRHCPTA